MYFSHCLAIRRGSVALLFAASAYYVSNSSILMMITAQISGVFKLGRDMSAGNLHGSQVWVRMGTGADKCSLICQVQVQV